ncbi:MAG TPA: Gfo/Idh/MocA family oxidoreductase [Anaeromyxobacter sp.]|nr:Gfo/Idh/MocA family oxidoreductase [Anaeromyxobacter sp.]
MARPLGFGLVGASTIAHEWVIDAIRAVPGSEVVAVFSTDRARGARYASDHRIAVAHSTLDALLSDPRVDAVYVSTTNELHRPQTVEAARAGKHVLCEKPLALSVAEAREMIDACEAAGVVLGTNHHLREAASHRKIRELVRSGAVGEPRFAKVFHAGLLPAHLQGWRLRDPKTGPGAILDLTVHDADTLRFILSAEPVEVVSLTQKGGMASDPIEDGAMTTIRFDNGVLAQLHDAFTVPFARTGVEVHGSWGSIYGRDVMAQRPTGEVLLCTARGDEVLPLEPENLYVRTVRAFVRAIRGEGQPTCTGEDGLRSLATALAALESARTGQRIAVDYGGNSEI